MPHLLTGDMWSPFIQVLPHCRDCGEAKPLTAFSRGNGGRFGRRTDCVQCHAAAHLASGQQWRGNFRQSCRRKGLEPSDEIITPEQLDARDGLGCAWCGHRDEPMQLDHVLPVALGGEHRLGNVQRLCVPCHRRKTADDLHRAKAGDAA